ncbi:MAG: type I phosphomannose isomerase catalytic subunit [Opitutaceae bacterium]
MKPLKFTPIYQERVWGGTDFTTKLGREDVPAGKVIGESWEIVDRPEAQSTTSDGSSLRELLQASPELIMGSGWKSEWPFPILVKWLDCQEKLSLQVHPPADIAPELGGQPKTECWYIAGATEDATLMAGLKNGVTREDFEAGLKANALEELVHTIPTQAGESIFIPSGRIHAIGGGNLILEIQQNSDTTYRVYDWGRVGLDGQPRQLHIEESMRSSDFEDFEPDTLKPVGARQVLVESDVFNLTRLTLAAGEQLQLPSGQPRIVSLVEGELTSAEHCVVARGENVIFPACSTQVLTASKESVILLTEDFNHAPTI